MAPEPRPATFVHGAFAGFAGILVLLQLVFAYEFQSLAAMYKEFGNVELPLLTRITMSSAWLWGMPAFGAAAVMFLLTKRPRPLAVYIGVATLLACIAMATWYFPRLPIYQLAGNISAD